MSYIKSEIEAYIGESIDSPFGQWLYKVDRLCEVNLGLGIFDLPDMAYRDEFENETRPSAMIAQIIDYNS